MASREGRDDGDAVAQLLRGTVYTGSSSISNLGVALAGGGCGLKRQVTGGHRLVSQADCLCALSSSPEIWVAADAGAAMTNLDRLCGAEGRYVAPLGLVGASVRCVRCGAHCGLWVVGCARVALRAVDRTLPVSPGWSPDMFEGPRLP